MKKQIILVDGSSYFYRAFHALPPLTTSRGEPTGAIHGVLNMLRKLVKDYKPSHLAVVFDAKGKTFRDDIYKDYKANRPPMPDDLKLQIKPLQEAISNLGMPLLIKDGVEADDVLGTLAIEAKNKGFKVIISTGDKDMAQLVDEDITLVNTMSEQVLDIDGVIKKFGVKPELIIDYLSLIGDKVDNVPGVQGCGPKTAVKWLDKYETLDGIIDNASDVGGKISERLQEALEQLPISKQLVTIKNDVDIGIAVEELTMGQPNADKLIPLFKKLEMNSWLKEVSSNFASSDKKVKPKDYKIVNTKKDLQNIISKIKQNKIFAFDTETTSLDAIQAELVGFSISTDGIEGAYIPINHQDASEKQLDQEYIIKELDDLFSIKDITVIGHNLKYDLNVLAKYNLQCSNTKFDTMIASYVLNTTNTRHDLDTLALKWLDHTTITFEQIAGKGKDQKTFDQIPIDIATNYAAEDADITYQLYNIFKDQLNESQWALKICETLEFPLIDLLSKIECKGVLVDEQILNAQSNELANSIENLIAQAIDIVGYEFNLSSPKQLQEILYEQLEIPVIKKTPKGQPSTAEAVLAELSYDYELPKIIMEYRQLSKLKSTYTDALPAQINSRTKRVHTSYNQTVTSTGRLSSTDPNLQNIPIRREEGRRIREAFVASKGNILISADYSQIELRVMAHLSKDKGLLTAFQNKLDVHSYTASDVFDVDIKDVSNEQRRRAKAINFGLIYGMSEFGLSKQLGITRFDAKKYIDIYFNRYPDVYKYIEDTKQYAHDTGYVESIFGRRLYLPEINSKNYQSRMAAERAAINAPVQGTAADIMKFAMLNVDEALSKLTYQADIIMQVHDELVIEVSAKHTNEVKDVVRNNMENAAKLDVSLDVDISQGKNWNDAH